MALLVHNKIIFTNTGNYHGNNTDDYYKVTEMIMIMWFAERERTIMMALVWNTIIFKNKQIYHENSVDDYDHKTIIFNNVHDYIGNTKDNENAQFAGGGNTV